MGKLTANSNLTKDDDATFIGRSLFYADTPQCYGTPANADFELYPPWANNIHQWDYHPYRCFSIRLKNQASYTQSLPMLAFLLGRVQDTQHAHRVASHVIDQDIVLLC